MKHVETEVNNKHLIVASCWSSHFILLFCSIPVCLTFSLRIKQYSTLIVFFLPNLIFCHQIYTPPLNFWIRYLTRGSLIGRHQQCRGTGVLTQRRRSRTCRTSRLNGVTSNKTTVRMLEFRKNFVQVYLRS
jgi:hypothetical protein